MGPLNLALLGLGALFIVVATIRGRGPYARMQQLAANEENLRRYEGWRGGRRTAVDSGPSSADLMRRELRTQVQRWAGLAIAGFVLIFVGFLLKA